MDKVLPTIGVLGASGLIGQALVLHLKEEGFHVVPIARRFTSAQEAALGKVVGCPVVGFGVGDLSRLLRENEIDIVVNCIGILQDGSRGTTQDVHHDFAGRLVAAMAEGTDPRLLVHLSVPGEGEEDETSFSVTKRAAERAISSGALPFLILRPGFVLARAAYGGSALFRSLAALPLDLPRFEAGRPFAVTDVGDIARSVAFVGRQWAQGHRAWAATWDVMHRDPSTVGEVLAAFRDHLGGPRRRLLLPSWLMAVGARMGDFVARLGWSPPIRTTSLQEMRRGVRGDPAPWIDAVGIEPPSLAELLRDLPATIQEKWFARLYLTKPLILGSLVWFWVASGLIALTVAFDTATAILTSHGFPPGLARAITVASSITDIAVGLAIAFKGTCRVGLLAGIAVSLSYMLAAALITPDMWLEPLGALVKTVPAIVLMLVALAILEDR